MARKKKSQESGGGAYWMDTYGDMITLVMTFFVLLYSFSTVDVAKWEALVASFTGAGSSAIAPLDPGGSIPPSIEELTQRDNSTQEEFNELYERIMKYQDENDLESVLMVERQEETILLRFLDSMLFDSGSAELRPDSEAMLTQIYGLFEETIDAIKVIRTEGHTDNVPIRNSKFSDNWDLSCIRATTVVRFIGQNVDIESAKMTAAGYGEFHPIDTNDTPQGRSRNRRVDIVVERNVLMESVDPADPESGQRSIAERTQKLWDEVTRGR